MPIFELPPEILDAVAAELAPVDDFLGVAEILSVLRLLPHSTSGLYRDISNFARVSKKFYGIGIKHVLQRISLPFLLDEDSIRLCEILLRREWACHVHALDMHQDFSLTPLQLTDRRARFGAALGAMINLKELSVNVSHLEMMLPAIDYDPFVGSSPSLRKVKFAGYLPSYANLLQASSHSLVELDLSYCCLSATLPSGTVFPKVARLFLSDVEAGMNFFDVVRVCFPSARSDIKALSFSDQ